MQSKRFGFWTYERLEELWRMINAEKPKTPQQIAKRFGKSLQEVYKTIEQVRKQKRYEKATHLDANGVRTTIYGPSYAQGAAPIKSALNKN